MSNKSARIVKKETVRSMAEINKEFSQLIGKVGQAQYQVHVYQNAVKELNSELERVNKEAARRQQLDSAKASTDPEQQELTNEEGENV